MLNELIGHRWGKTQGYPEGLETKHVLLLRFVPLHASFQESSATMANEFQLSDISDLLVVVPRVIYIEKDCEAASGLSR